MRGGLHGDRVRGGRDTFIPADSARTISTTVVHGKFIGAVIGAAIDIVLIYNLGTFAQSRY